MENRCCISVGSIGLKFAKHRVGRWNSRKFFQFPKLSGDLSDCEKKIGESLTAEDAENPEDAEAHQPDLRAVRGSFIQDEGHFFSHRGRVKGDWERLVFRDSGMQGCLIPSVWRDL